MKIYGRLFGCVLIGMLLVQGVGCSEMMRNNGRTEIYVFIAASLSNAMEQIKADYERENPDVLITFNSDSSGTLKTQIEEGAECDLFFSAAYKQMDELVADGYVEPDTVTGLLENRVVLIRSSVTETKVTGFESITDASNIALAGEDVPVGAYAREIFRNIGNHDAVMKMEINECANVTAVLAAVSEASNEIGIVYRTDAASAGDAVTVIAGAPNGSLKTPVGYPAGIVKNEKADKGRRDAANAFLAYLSSDSAKRVFRQYGFECDPD